MAEIVFFSILGKLSLLTSLEYLTSASQMLDLHHLISSRHKVAVLTAPTDLTWNLLEAQDLRNQVGIISVDIGNAFHLAVIRDNYAF